MKQKKNQLSFFLPPNKIKINYSNDQNLRKEFKLTKIRKTQKYVDLWF